jgi:hypothetical protein
VKRTCSKPAHKVRLAETSSSESFCSEDTSTRILGLVQELGESTRDQHVDCTSARVLMLSSGYWCRGLHACVLLRIFTPDVSRRLHRTPSGEVKCHMPDNILLEGSVMRKGVDICGRVSITKVLVSITNIKGSH